MENIHILLYSKADCALLDISSLQFIPSSLTFYVTLSL